MRAPRTKQRERRRPQDLQLVPSTHGCVLDEDIIRSLRCAAIGFAFGNRDSSTELRACGGDSEFGIVAILARVCRRYMYAFSDAHNSTVLIADIGS